MDFLDPFHRHRRRRRLAVVYLLIGLAIAASTVILFYITNGYGFNPRTHSIVHNGLVFIDSQPSGANIKLNGTDRNDQTSARLVLPAGSYNLTLTKTGYHSWQRDFQLAEQTVKRMDYALLLPTKPTIKIIRRYERLPTVFSVSPDRRWLVVGGQTSTAVSWPPPLPGLASQLRGGFKVSGAVAGLLASYKRRSA